MFGLGKISLLKWQALTVGILTCMAGCGYIVEQSSRRPPDVRVSQVRYTMGTLMDITVYAPSESEGLRLLDGAFAITERLNQELSTWIADSPVSVFNRQQSTEPLRVSEDIHSLVAISKRLSNDTDGAFSITVRPLVNLWEHAAKRNKLPSEGEISRTRQLVSPDALEVVSPNSVKKRFADVMIETGGLGKGYAVDETLTFLRAEGVSAAFVNFGRSSLGAIGAPPGEDGWVVDVALVEGTSDARISLRDETLSVSRARGNPFVVNGRSYAHIFDPATGRPVSISRGAATRGKSATEGEAYVKYLVIRGAPTMDISKRWGGARWMVREGERLEESQGFRTSRASAALE